MSSVIAQAAQCNTRCIANKPEKQFITPEVCRGLKKKYKGIPDSYYALGLIVFKIELLCFNCLKMLNCQQISI